MLVVSSVLHYKTNIHVLSRAMQRRQHQEATIYISEARLTNIIGYILEGLRPRKVSCIALCSCLTAAVPPHPDKIVLYLQPGWG